MKISAIAKKSSDGMCNIYFVINKSCFKSLISTGIKTKYAIKKVEGASLGFSLDRKEPAMRIKMKRLEDFYWELYEYALSHPDMRPANIKEAFSVARTKGKGMLPKLLEEYANSGRVSASTGEIYKRTARKVMEFDPAAGFGIDEDWLDRFCLFLKRGGTKVNGVGIHLRNIRTAFNYARKKKLTKEYPFIDYKIKVERKAVNNMTLEQVRKFRTYPCEAWQEEYRDIWMLSFYLGGMNIGDLLTCRRLVNGRVVYYRAKTQKPITVPVCDEARRIIDKYKGKDFLINPCDRYKDYHGYMHRMNDGLKKIGVTRIVPDKVGKMRKKEVTPFFDGLTTYVARYSFASVAAELGINRDIIAACLGHSWADVTSHYIAYSQKQIDEAILKVAEAVI